MTYQERPGTALAQLRETLVSEIREYHGLIRLTRRQNRFMRRQSLVELDALTRAWEVRRPMADGSRNRRLEAQERAARVLQLPADTSLTQIIRTGGMMTSELESLRLSHRKAVEALARQNELNGRLARFCLDLIAGEANALRVGINNAAGGTYDGRGAMAAGSGSVVVRQA